MPPMYEYKSCSISGEIVGTRCLVENVICTRILVSVDAIGAAYQLREHAFGVHLHAAHLPGVAFRFTPGYSR
jgi:hypothetical protein